MFFPAWALHRQTSYSVRLFAGAMRASIHRGIPPVLIMSPAQAGPHKALGLSSIPWISEAYGALRLTGNIWCSQYPCEIGHFPKREIMSVIGAE